jgi:DNA-binding MarR family transcriptional regulator
MRGQFKGGKVHLDKALPFLINAVYQRIRTVTYRAFGEHGLELTPEQWIVLVRLWQEDGRTQSELCESTFRDKPTMSRILDVMERGALVRRVPSETDARARIVRLTPTGKALQPKLVPLAKQVVAQLERGIPQEDLEITHRTLARMLANLE